MMINIYHHVNIFTLSFINLFELSNKTLSTELYSNETINNKNLELKQTTGKCNDMSALFSYSNSLKKCTPWLGAGDDPCLPGQSYRMLGTVRTVVSVAS